MPIFNIRNLIIGVLDFLLLEAALLLACGMWIAFPWHGNYQSFSDFSLILWILPPLGIVVFKWIGLYKAEIGILGIEEQSLIFKGLWVIYLTVFSLSFFYRRIEFSRLAILYSLFLAILFISFERFIIRHAFERLNEKGVGVQRGLIYGAGYHGQRLARWIHQSPRLGIRIVGFVDDDIERLVKKPVSPPYIGGFEDLKEIVRKERASILFIAHRKLEEEGIIEIFQTCRTLGVQCWMIPALYHFHVERAQLINIGGIPLVGFRNEFSRNSNLILKEFLDRLLAVLMLPVLLPFFAFMIAGIRLTSPGPIFFKQIRVGKNGKKFEVLKFRTLSKNSPAHAISPELQKGAGSKTTRFSAFLRRTGLDEVPQILNVLKGEMSLVGPRPEMPFIVEKYGALERERLTVKPGITGLWQISEDRKRLLIHENMDYDLYYVEHLSLNLDLAILMKTIAVVLRRFLQKPWPEDLG